MPFWNSNHSRRYFSRFSDSIICTLRRESKIDAGIACFHNHTGTRSSLPPPPPHRLDQSEVWFVKVVCTVCFRFSPSLDIFHSNYFSKNLTPTIAFNVIRCIGTFINNPHLAFNFFQFTKNNLKLFHCFATYDFLLRSLCQMGIHDLAKLVYEYMRVDGYSPDSSCLGFLVSSFAHIGEFDVAKEFLVQALSSENVEVSPQVYNNLLSLLVKGNRVAEAVCFFRVHILSSKNCNVDTFTFNIVIRALCGAREVDKAFEFFNGMGRFNCLPNLMTYNILINGLCRVGEVDRGRELLREIQSGNGFHPDVVTYTSMISGYSKLGNMEAALNIFDEMINCGTKPNLFTFNVLINGFVKKGDMASALNMHEKMRFLGCIPDVVTFTSLLDGYCRSGQVDQGLKLWDEMNVKNLYPNVYTFAILINALCKENRINEARDLLRQLKSRGDIVPRPFIYNPVIDGFCKAGNIDEANVIVAEMAEKRCNPDKLTYTILIIGHCVKGRMLEAISIFNKMLAVGCAPDAITVNSLINCLLKAGMPNEAFKIMQTASEDLKLDMPSLRRTIPFKTNMDITVAV
ncbi:pentatricopeptide repeat-containing protein At2g06000 [Cornus florida]|uniref:pentatricopeptide repeat-containing protein At2g06000 n=1 Tax=Cornus florida TaxID=4283 RepID=UPI0028A08861|nr:pentatricopeptide repeat-containing protein At2g06000 [Cornus florida]XP_059648119.1 pentatricopeptide repeat-containing protein At2g06000 [Cornus florida]XP_059648120.1 pentatricopeptide repeat-containing protein At2g06000 [Cornus florida]